MTSDARTWLASVFADRGRIQVYKDPFVPGTNSATLSDAGAVTRLVDMGPARRGNVVLFRWRSDGKSIDFISGTDPHGGRAFNSVNG